MTRKQWLKERKTGIGGSEASAVIGRNPYKTNIDLWEEKAGRRQAEDIGHKAYVQYGLKAEKPIIELFKLDYPQYEVTSKPYDLKRHPTYPFLFVTPDGELIERETGRLGVLEVKTTELMSSMHKEKWNDQVPQNYYIQLLHAMLVKGYEFAILKARIRTKFEGHVRITERHYYYERADVQGDIDYLLAEELKFWNEHVVPGKEPPIRLPNI